MKFTKMIDSQWHTIQKHLPKPASTGRPRCDYSLHCTEEQSKDILKHQRISLAVKALAEAYDTTPYQLMAQYANLKQNEKQSIRNQEIIHQLKSKLKFHEGNGDLVETTLKEILGDKS